MVLMFWCNNGPTHSLLLSTQSTLWAQVRCRNRSSPELWFQTAQRLGFPSPQNWRYWPRSSTTSPRPCPSVSTALCTPNQAHWTGTQSVAAKGEIVYINLKTPTTIWANMILTDRIKEQDTEVQDCGWHVATSIFQLNTNIKDYLLSRRWPGCQTLFLLPEHLMDFHQELWKP